MREVDKVECTKCIYFLLKLIFPNYKSNEIPLVYLFLEFQFKR